MLKKLIVWMRVMALFAAVLFALAGCASTADAPKGTFQYVPPPCGVPGLSQEQYRMCVAHMFCDTFARKKITLGERMPSDPRTDEEYRQCVKDRSFDPGAGWYWEVKP
jgi:hypothetical protein